MKKKTKRKRHSRKNWDGKCKGCNKKISIVDLIADRFTCKPCMALFHRKYGVKNREKISKVKKEYTKNNYTTEKDRIKKQKFPEKTQARLDVMHALRNGKLKRKPCSVCKSKISQAHHEDYSKPLQVIWLCRIHHAEKHRKFK